MWSLYKYKLHAQICTNQPNNFQMDSILVDGRKNYQPIAPMWPWKNTHTQYYLSKLERSRLETVTLSTCLSDDIDFFFIR